MAKKIRDYGDKIGGAKKDLRAAYAEKLAMEVGEDIASLSLAEVFPKPNYAALSEDGVSHFALAMLCACRGSIGSRPGNAESLKRWADDLLALRAIGTVAIKPENDDAFLHIVLDACTKSIRDTVEMLMEVPVEALSAAEGYSFHFDAPKFLLVKGNKYKPSEVELDRDSAMARFRGILTNLAMSPAKKSEARSVEARARDLRDKAKIYDSGNGTKRLAIQKNGVNYGIGPFHANLKEARAWYKDNKDDVLAEIITWFNQPEERTGVMRPRTGPDRRRGNVSEAEFCREFKFRAAEFGESVSPLKRQEDLNNAWDAFHDFAAAHDLPVNGVGSFGAMAMAFGSRGGGKYKAHYERGKRVINLTNINGAGHLAHEWGHNVDNARMIEAPSNKEARSLHYFSINTGKDAAMTRLANAWQDYRNRMVKLDMGRSKDYWSQPWEMFARCFEKLTKERLAEKGIVNDYLVDIPPTSHAYPTDAEMDKIRPHLEEVVIDMMNHACRDWYRGMTYYEPPTFPEINRNLQHIDLTAEIPVAMQARLDMDMPLPEMRRIQVKPKEAAKKPEQMGFDF